MKRHTDTAEKNRSDYDQAPARLLRRGMTNTKASSVAIRPSDSSPSVAHRWRATGARCGTAPTAQPPSDSRRTIVGSCAGLISEGTQIRRPCAGSFRRSDGRCRHTPACLRVAHSCARTHRTPRRTLCTCDGAGPCRSASCSQRPDSFQRTTASAEGAQARRACPLARDSGAKPFQGIRNDISDNPRCKPSSRRTCGAAFDLSWDVTADSTHQACSTFAVK